VILLILFHANAMVSAGFLIAAVCPGAPYGPPLTGMAKGNVAASVGLMVILAGSSAIIAPLLLSLLLPMMAGNEPMRVDAVKMVITLMATQLVPLCLGLAVRRKKPDLAARMKKPANLLSVVLNFLVFGLILAVQYKTLLAIRARGFAGMLALLVAALAAGGLLGGPGRESRKALALTTAVRNVGVGLVIATASFPGTPAVTAVIAYAVFQTVVLLVLALWWGRLDSAKPGMTVGAAA
jgi:BASS family bile acid:Na+ symporter